MHYVAWDSHYIVMAICMASYMMIGYMNANNIFRVNIRSEG
jgi:hypothetical protein